MKALKLIFDPLNLMTGMQQAIKLAHHCLGAELYELSISNFLQIKFSVYLISWIMYLGSLNSI